MRTEVERISVREAMNPTPAGVRNCPISARRWPSSFRFASSRSRSAITKTCSSSPCFGTAQDDTLTERPGVKDVIYGLSGDDTIRAGLTERNDRQDKDILRGGPGNDRINAFDLSDGDVLYGGRGRDKCIVDSGDPYYGCEVAVWKVF